MSNIGNYQSNVNNNGSAYVKPLSCTERVRKFVEYLHDFIPTITQEFDDLEKRKEAKPCKAFDDKLRALDSIYRAEKDLYYWYIEQPRNKAL